MTWERWFLTVLAVAQLLILWEEPHSVWRWISAVACARGACLAHLRAVRYTALGRKLSLTKADFR